MDESSLRTKVEQILIQTVQIAYQQNHLQHKDQKDIKNDDPVFQGKVCQGQNETVQQND